MNINRGDNSKKWWKYKIIEIPINEYYSTLSGIIFMNIICYAADIHKKIDNYKIFGKIIQ